MVANVGFDPRRQHKKSSFDYWFVGTAVVVCILLVVWAFFG